MIVTNVCYEVASMKTKVEIARNTTVKYVTIQRCKFAVVRLSTMLDRNCDFLWQAVLDFFLIIVT